MTIEVIGLPQIRHGQAAALRPIDASARFSFGPLLHPRCHLAVLVSVFVNLL
jgi:hypothetical protein